MKFKSALITQASGSIGGATYAHNQGGLYVRARSIPVNPNTVQQVAVRNALAQLTGRWRNTLTPAQREAWANYATLTPIADAFGDFREIPPLAMYVRCNTPRLQAGLDIVDDASPLGGLPSMGTLSFEIDAGGEEVDVTFGTDFNPTFASADGASVMILASRPQPPTINFFAGPYRFAGSIDGDSTTPPTSPATIALPFAAVSGSRVFFQARYSDSLGRLSSPFRYFDDLA